MSFYHHPVNTQEQPTESVLVSKSLYKDKYTDADYFLVDDPRTWLNSACSVVRVGPGKPGAGGEPHLMALYGIGYRSDNCATVQHANHMHSTLSMVHKTLTTHFPNSDILVPYPDAAFFARERLTPSCTGHPYQLSGRFLACLPLAAPAGSQLDWEAACSLEEWTEEHCATRKAFAMALLYEKAAKVMEAAGVYHPLYPGDVIMVPDLAAGGAPRLAIMGGWLGARPFGATLHAFELRHMDYELAHPELLRAAVRARSPDWPGVRASARHLRYGAGVVMHRVVHGLTPQRQLRGIHNVSQALRCEEYPWCCDYEEYPEATAAVWLLQAQMPGDSAAQVAAGLGNSGDALTWPPKMRAAAPPHLVAAVNGMLAGCDLHVCPRVDSQSEGGAEAEVRAVVRSVVQAAVQRVVLRSQETEPQEAGQQGPAPDGTRAAHLEEAGGDASGLCTPRSSGSGSSRSSSAGSSACGTVSRQCSSGRTTHAAWSEGADAALPEGADGCDDCATLSGQLLSGWHSEDAVYASTSAFRDTATALVQQRQSCASMALGVAAEAQASALHIVLAGCSAAAGVVRAAGGRLRRWGAGPVQVTLACVAVAAGAVVRAAAASSGLGR